MNNPSSSSFSGNILTDAFAFLLSTPQTRYAVSNTNAQISIQHGFWGPVDASLDWCEPNYIITPYIAEFWNTISAIPMFTWSLVGWYLCYRSGVKESRFKILLASLGFIGIGSVCFHGTLRFSAQLLDELPMMIASYCSLFCALEIEKNKPKKRVIIGCFVGMIFQGLSYAIFKWYIIFIVGYSIVMITQIIIIFSHIFADFRNKGWNSQSTWFAIIGLVMILSSCTLWILENAFCEQLGKFKLHAVWHVFGGYGLFLFDLLLILLRGEYLKKQTNIKWSKEVACHFVEWIDV
mmetsp:Transcript_29704/g.26270  ORF Transcript_29704/g.26270 Transcript_29704/m.26270 type:complete len:293 (+) Transcript_29704:211-1089(+)